MLDPEHAAPLPPPFKYCSSGHSTIQYQGEQCPLCAALRVMADLQDDARNWEQTVHRNETQHAKDMGELRAKYITAVSQVK